MPIELRHLRYALAARGHRSFRKAAEALRLKQSSLSRRIRQLEDELGIPLFVRTSGGVQPTRAGRDLLQMAERITGDVEALALLASKRHQAKAGHLNIGFYTSLSAGYLRVALLDFTAHCPDAIVTAFEEPRASLFAKLQRGVLDILIVSGESEEHGLERLSLWAERILVALPQTHRLAAETSVSWSDLKGEHFILSNRDPGPEIEDMLVGRLAAPGDRPNIVRQNVNRETVLNMVGAGWGISVIYEAASGTAPPGVVYRELHDGHGPTRIGHSAYWRGDSDNPLLLSFIARLKQHYPSGTA